MIELNRRKMLGGVALAASAGPAIAQSVSIPAGMDAVSMAALVRSGAVTASQSIETAILRADQVNPALNFIVNKAYTRARDQVSSAQASQTFMGVPFFVKDLVEVEGVKTRYGSRCTVNLPVASGQSLMISTYEDLGLIPLGKSAASEFGLLPTTEPLAFGPNRNPWSTRRSTGGSSGGAATAVAAGVVPIAHATDGGGSIRIPASCCGVFGLKPSKARMLGSTNGDVTDLAVEHAITRTVRDSALLLASTERKDFLYTSPVGYVSGPASRRLRIGYLWTNGSAPSVPATIRNAVTSTASLLNSLGHTATQTVWALDAARFMEDFITVWSAAANYDYNQARLILGRTPTSSDLEPFTLSLAQQFQATPGANVGAAVSRLTADAVTYANWFTNFDVIMTPTLAQLPMPIGQLAGNLSPFSTLLSRVKNYAAFTPLANVAGAPAMSVPLGWATDGTPIGVQFMARRFDERTLFELAYELEAARPWDFRRPAVFAS